MNVKNINQNSENIIDNNGYVSIVEAFNYAWNHDSRRTFWNLEHPQYEDNGDAIGNEGLIPNGDNVNSVGIDGNLGMNTYL